MNNDTMIKEANKKGGSGKRYSVFAITNQMTKTTHYIISSLYTLENVVSKIKTYADSKTVRGGGKKLADDIEDAGKDYDKKFTAQQVGSGLSREAAEARRAELVSKAGNVYNQEINIT